MCFLLSWPFLAWYVSQVHALSGCGMLLLQMVVVVVRLLPVVPK